MDESLNKNADADEAPPPHRGGGGADEVRAQSWWSLASIVCLIVAVPCLLTGQLSAAFVVATLGVVAWFLNVRGQLKREHPVADDEDGADESESGSVADAE